MSWEFESKIASPSSTAHKLLTRMFSLVTMSAWDDGMGCVGGV